MVSDEIISDSIRVATTYGNAITVIPCAEAMLKTTDGLSSGEQVQRDDLRRTQTPQAFRIGSLINAHEEAKQKGINNSIASCTLMIELGRKVHFSMGSEKNIKLTTPDDVEIFKALLKSKKSEWMR
jgi:2-C-methyl-D-erythritol 4-phosphate cytidylyltransferase